MTSFSEEIISGINKIANILNRLPYPNLKVFVKSSATQIETMVSGIPQEYALYLINKVLLVVPLLEFKMTREK